jgi:hypothetical protein
MQKLLLVGSISCLMLTAGCVSKSSSIPNVGTPDIPFSTTATVDVLGPAQGISSGGVLFGFIPIGCEKKSGSAGMYNPDPVARAAIYNAIESVKGADALIAPRYKKDVTSYIIYKKTTVAVKGKAVRYNTNAK